MEKEDSRRRCLNGRVKEVRQHAVRRPRGRGPACVWLARLIWWRMWPVYSTSKKMTASGTWEGVVQIRAKWRQT